MRKFSKSIGCILLIFAFIFLTCRTAYKLRDGFALRKIHNFPKFSPTGVSLEEEKILNQTFRYLSRGRQSFVFISEDQKYVLKIPRTDHLNLPILAKAFPNIFKNTKKNLKSEENKIQKSFEIAETILLKETALIGIYKGAKAQKPLLIKIQDPLGIQHALDASSMCFSLQKKLPLWTDEFLKNINSREEMIRSLLTLFLDRSKKFVVNLDDAFSANFGYENGISYQIDIGDFSIDPRTSSQDFNERRFLDSIIPVKKWLENYDTTKLEFFDQEIHKMLLLEKQKT